MTKTSAWEAELARLAEAEIDWSPEYLAWEYERWLLDYDATTDDDFPEDGSFGCLYLLGLSDGWIKVGRTTQWWTRRRAALHLQVGDRHTLTVEREWKTPSLPLEELRRAETLVRAYARQLADASRLTYNRRGSHAPSLETEMFHGVDFGRIRAYADVIGRCDALW